MLQVSFTGSLRSAVGGEEELQMEAKTIRELVKNLVERFPLLRQHFEQGIAVAVNGEIYRDNWDVDIDIDAEVFLLPRIQGG